MVANGIELATAYVALTVDGSQVNAGVRKSLSGVDAQADAVGRSSGKKMGSGISAGVLGAVTKVAGPLAAVFAGIKVGQILGDSISEALDAQKVAAATDAIIKSTGGAAKTSASDVAALSEALSQKVGMDDELIQTGANLLLTFKNVRNEAGKNNKVFDDAVGLAADLSAAGFGSVESASKMLGKALNDPLKGLTALGRAGVTFSEDQKKQIKRMVESGDILGAQKVILGEVKSQVGGVAEATATTADKVRVSWDNVKEQIGTALLPMLERLGKWFLEKGLPAIQKFGGWVKDELWPALKDGWETIQPGLQQAKDIILGAFGGDSESTLRGFSDFFTNTLIPVISTFVNDWLPIMARQLAATIEVIKLVWGAFITLRDIVIRVTSVILEAFSRMLNGAADMFEAISVIPGFGWAKGVADKLRGVAEKADAVRDAINKIPKNVDVEVSFHTSVVSGVVSGATLGVLYPKKRESGGPVRKGQPYVVGEKRPELFVPNQNGTIVPRVPEGAGGSASMGGFDYWRLAEAMTDTMRQATFAVGVDPVTRAVNARNAARAMG